MDYKILTYKPIPKFPEKHFDLEKPPVLSIKSSRGFNVMGFNNDPYEKDLKDILVRANKVIREIENDRNNTELRDEISSIYNEFVECYKYTGTRELGFQFTQYLLGIRLYSVVALQVIYNANESYVDPISSDNALNYDFLYIKAGDRALYEDFNVNNAVDLYDEKTKNKVQLTKKIN